MWYIKILPLFCLRQLWDINRTCILLTWMCRGTVMCCEGVRWVESNILHVFFLYAKVSPNQLRGMKKGYSLCLSITYFVMCNNFVLINLKCSAWSLSLLFLFLMHVHFAACWISWIIFFKGSEEGNYDIELNFPWLQPLHNKWLTGVFEDGCWTLSHALSVLPIPCSLFFCFW